MRTSESLVDDPSKPAGVPTVGGASSQARTVEITEATVFELARLLYLDATFEDGITTSMHRDRWIEKARKLLASLEAKSHG